MFKVQRLYEDVWGIEFEIQDHQIVLSIYFYDPDGHLIELTTDI